MTDQSIVTAIQTAYAQHLFRSRLEARYAVFFDALGLKWAYEHEGYDLGPLGWYLPDFLLTEWPLWIEVKGQPPTQDELNKCAQLSRHTHAVALFVGLPHSEPGYVWCYDHTDSGGGEYHSDAVRWITLPDHQVGLVSLEDGRNDRVFHHDETWSCDFSQLITLGQFEWGTGTDRRIVAATTAAASARFERGGRT